MKIKNKGVARTNSFATAPFSFVKSFTASFLLRDEIRFFINDLDARAFASQGQMRTAAVSLKIAQGMLLEAETGEEPCIFLDDILGELDVKRRTFLLESMENKQIFLTCTEKNGVEPRRDCTYFEVSGGKICIST